MLPSSEPLVIPSRFLFFRYILSRYARIQPVAFRSSTGCRNTATTRAIEQLPRRETLGMHVYQQHSGRVLLYEGNVGALNAESVTEGRDEGTEANRAPRPYDIWPLASTPPSSGRWHTALCTGRWHTFPCSKATSLNSRCQPEAMNTISDSPTFTDWELKKHTQITTLSFRPPHKYNFYILATTKTIIQTFTQIRTGSKDAQNKRAKTMRD